MKFSVLTIFPELFDSFRDHGIVRKALERRQVKIDAVNIRDYAQGRHRVTDDRPYGGGAGMVMKPEPLAAAIRAVKDQRPEAPVVLLSPQGKVLSQQLARQLATSPELILVCGRYEGMDERIHQSLIDTELSIGDFVLTGGEVAAMVVMDAVIRLLPGVLGDDASAEHDSFSEDLLEHAHYTRPSKFEGQSVPEVLLSGDHAEISRWRQESALIRTLLKRPDLLAQRQLTPWEIEILKKWGLEIESIIRAQSVFGTDSPPGTK